MLALTSLALAAATQPWHTFEAKGVQLRRPPGWDATSRRLTNVTYPPQLLAIASYPLRRPPAPDGCAPVSALVQMPPDGALIVVLEYAKPYVFGPPRVRDFPPRPKRFRLRPRDFGRRHECFGPGYVMTFREAGRFFQIQVALGRRAGATTRERVRRILDSFRAKPV